MAQITLQGNPFETVGELPATGSQAPAFTLTDSNLQPRSLEEFEGTGLILNIFPSVDTGVCAKSTREFNVRASDLDSTTILTISADLPFALGRFCSAEGIENLEMLSTYRSPNFGDDYGIEIVDGPFRGLLARAVVILDANHEVIYTELVPEIGHEPNYDAAIEAATIA